MTLTLTPNPGAFFSFFSCNLFLNNNHLLHNCSNPKHGCAVATVLSRVERCHWITWINCCCLFNSLSFTWLFFKKFAKLNLFPASRLHRLRRGCAAAAHCTHPLTHVRVT
jgi:hypothetical protein